jgi:hypothetical protein
MLRRTPGCEGATEYAKPGRNLISAVAQAHSCWAEMRRCGVVQKPLFLGNTDERNRSADDGGEFTRKDVKSMQGAVRRESPQLRRG